MDHRIFVTFEGLDGCGKSTQINKLAKWLTSNNNKVFMTREPGGTALGEQIRSLLKSIENSETICPLAELMLFEACRAQHVNEKILPALKKNQIVLCDRFIDSSSVYQGLARNIGMSDIDLLNKIVTSNCFPNLTFIIDIPVECIAERINNRGCSVDRIENENSMFFEIVRAGYLKLARTDRRFFVIDGTKSIESIAQQIKDEFSKRFL